MIINKLKNLNFFKLLLWFGILNVLIFSAFAAYLYLHVEKPDAGRDAFYASNQVKVPDNQNVAVALAGLNAPVDTDIFQHGRFVIDTHNKIDNYDLAKKMIADKNPLVFVGDTDAIYCWLDDTHIGEYKSCADAAQVKSLIAINSTLLQRYTHLNSLKYWQGNSEFSGQLVVNLNRLLTAEIKLDIDEGRSELAYQKWRDNFLFVNRANSQESTMIERAIFLVIDGLSINILEYCLFKSPEIASTHADELNALLKPSSLKRFNIEAMMKGDYHFIDNNLMIKQADNTAMNAEYIRNRIYRHQTEFLKHAYYPPLNYDKSSAYLAEKYSSRTSIFNYDWLNPINSWASKTFSDVLAKCFYLLKSMHSHNAKIKLLNMRVIIHQQNIAVADIDHFLKNADDGFNNPITNEKMQWDATKKVLFFNNPWQNNKIEVRL
jgi:hypothetical protein